MCMVKPTCTFVQNELQVTTCGTLHIDELVTLLELMCTVCMTLHILFKNLRRHEPDLTPDRTWWREAHELQGLHSHTGSISWARTRETRRAQNAYTCGEVVEPGRCGSGGTKSTFLGVSDTGPRGHFVDLGEI